MTLIIKKSNNVYDLEGSLNKLNVHVFQNKFQNIFNTKSDLILSIVNLEKIDSAGVNAIAKLHNESIIRLKRLSIIGLGNQELFDRFKAIETSKIRDISSFNGVTTIFMKLQKLFKYCKRRYTARN
ncbi:hypothetical protein [Flavobacteriaceae bacterium 14752]|uniref:hypothetical protein n=1 Tax=Mesohalobacter salilacus TaxID=2491711 RepID=UPI000F63EB76|nr:hypothetical protein EIG84_07115 [Flavobacteriaceae bacterium 14752]